VKSFAELHRMHLQIPSPKTTKSLSSEGSGWLIDSVDNHYLNIVEYKPIKGKSYIKLPKELRNSMKGLINVKNYDNECFRWCHIRHLYLQQKNPQRIIFSQAHVM